VIIVIGTFNDDFMKSQRRDLIVGQDAIIEQKGHVMFMFFFYFEGCHGRVQVGDDSHLMMCQFGGRCQGFIALAKGTRGGHAW